MQLLVPVAALSVVLVLLCLLCARRLMPFTSPLLPILVDRCARDRRIVLLFSAKVLFAQPGIITLASNANRVHDEI